MVWRERKEKREKRRRSGRWVERNKASPNASGERRTGLTESR